MEDESTSAARSEVCLGDCFLVGMMATLATTATVFGKRQDRF